MGEKPVSKDPPSFILAPATFEDQYKRRPPVQQASWWTLCTRWLQYHSIQVRWDIERWLARLFHRRWGA
ncbi:MAG: hypothetical protein E6J33_09415 [Chloroflexi bacterium]|nr:MAG: hypothetical protein E6J33_09415 [Chloroflexota bacterium]